MYALTNEDSLKKYTTFSLLADAIVASLCNTVVGYC